MAVPSGVHRCFFRGQSVSLEKLLSIFASEVCEQVVFIGENHEHSVAQQLELRILEALWLSSQRQNRQLLLSLEFLDRSQQHVLNEAMLRDEIESVVPEPYVPLVRFARTNNLAVLAANAPRSITSRVAKQGQQAVMETLSPKERAWCAPTPWPAPSNAYSEAFQAIMQQVMRPDPSSAQAQQERMQRMLQAQSLWDATMAFSIAEALERYPKAQVLHVTGFFHVSNRLGTVEMLAHYRNTVNALVSIVYPEELQHSTSALDGDVVIYAP